MVEVDAIGVCFGAESSSVNYFIDAPDDSDTETGDCSASSASYLVLCRGGPLASVVCRLLPIASLPAFRRVSKSWHGTLCRILQTDMEICRALDAYYESVLSGSFDKRVWVAVRARPQKDVGCVEIKRNRVTLSREDESSCKGQAGATFFFNAAFDGSVSQSRELFRRTGERKQSPLRA
eukprot:TRINITY_DN27600_c0_g1_i2.p1 TRINITY_DN27600_c0_g1~~TRINITY_DN27600_c0_g1_i2.p1  ORF type:complete len:179 (+),score=14.23 TRINITY_DN27600_c0_g1_i2:80-616(+)